jgi:lipid II:glycine glycyltransferase (peptidoglycan interpeptide bridge formation enzyme)
VKLEGEEEVPKKMRGNRKILKNTVKTIDIKADDLDLEDMKKFFRYSKKTQEKDL